MRGKSIKINFILNTVRVGLSVLFPLITFPYVSRVLGADALGRVSFGESVVTLVSLVASLGVSAYAIREGAIIRNDRSKVQKFSSEIFTVNIISTFLSYVLLFVIVLLSSKLFGYRELIFILSIGILFNTVGMDWLYSVHEDYLYITIRSVIMQLVSLALLFIFVKSPDDYITYALISVVSSAGANIFNFIHARKYFKPRLTRNLNLKTHLKPLLTLFSNDVAKRIYISSDVTMLGFLATDYNVGLYHASAKIYNIVKNLLNSVITVTTPRLAYYRENNEIEYNRLNKKVFSCNILTVVPAIVWIVLLRDQIILLAAGSDYTAASSSLAILSAGLLFAVLANFFSNAVLVVNKKEKYALRATVLAAVLNVILNLIFIPLLKQDGAAMTTCVAEFVVMAVSIYYSKNIFRMREVKKDIVHCLLGCIGVAVVCISAKIIFRESSFLTLVIASGASMLVYAIILLMFRNDLALDTISLIKRILRRKK